MTAVFIVSKYHEYGLEEPAVATIDRSRILALFDTQWPDYQHERRQLEKALETSSDADLCTALKTELSDGWGGLQLTVLELK